MMDGVLENQGLGPAPHRGRISNYLHCSAGEGDGVIRILAVETVEQSAEARDFPCLATRDHGRDRNEMPVEACLMACGYSMEVGKVALIFLLPI